MDNLTLWSLWFWPIEGPEQSEEIARTILYRIMSAEALRETDLGNLEDLETKPLGDEVGLG